MSKQIIAGQLWKNKKEEEYYFVNEVSYKDDIVVLDTFRDEPPHVTDWHTSIEWLCFHCERVK